MPQTAPQHHLIAPSRSRRCRTLRGCLAAFCLSLLAFSGYADTARIAVAANFQAPVKALGQRFEQHTGHRLVFSFGSTGKHYAQISHGAPFDAFFAADAQRPHKLEQEGLALPGSRFTYALGRLVLWSPNPVTVDQAGQVLHQGDFNRLAIANPRLAPYGAAAEQTLRGLGLWERLRARLVRGENISQTYQFVVSGNAQLGFVALSQLQRPGQLPQGSHWIVPDSLYAPIEQQAVQLKDNAVARDFLAFVRSPEGRALIERYGYGLPAQPHVEKHER